MIYQANIESIETRVISKTWGDPLETRQYQTTVTIDGSLPLDLRKPVWITQDNPTIQEAPHDR